MNSILDKLVAYGSTLLLAGSLCTLFGCSSPSEQEGATEAPVIQTAASATQEITNSYEVTRSANASVADQTTDYTEIAIEQRGPYCDVANAQTATILVYLCGADLESSYGAATADLNEMMYGTFGSNVNVIVETGGASQWQNSVVDASMNCYYHLTTDGLELLEDVGLRDMTDPSTLQDFIEYGAGTFPADRMMLVMWDHGGGTLGGFGVDENFPGSECMTIAEIHDAVAATGVKFDLVGFDACLMATVETAFALEDCADYLLASQRPEPSTGWDYERWIGELSDNPSMPTGDLAECIIDDFVADATSNDQTVDATLSAMDLTQLPGLMDAMGTFFEQAGAQLTAADFAEYSQARAETAAGRSSDTEYDLVDLKYLADNFDSILDSDALLQAVEQFVVCAKGNLESPAGNGVNVYFPYNDITQFPAMANLYAEIGFERSYFDFLASFVTLMSGGQVSSSSTYAVDTAPEVDWDSYSWFNSGLAEETASGNEYAALSESLEVTDKDGEWVLSLTDDEWGLITTVEQQVLYDDGEGYVDLGADTVYEFDEDGDLIISFDNTWLSLDGETVCFYFAAEDFEASSWYTYGYVPALVNDEYCNIVVQWDAKHEGGYVVGYTQEAASLLASRGPVPFEEGDVIQYLCDYYDHDGTFDNTYLWGNGVIYSQELTVGYEDIGWGDCVVTYLLTDIFGNTYETEPVAFTDS